MAIKKRKVDLYRLDFSATNDQNQEMSFPDFILSYLNGTTHPDNFKHTYFQILRDTDEYFVLGVTTTKMYGIPPKNNVINHQTAPLDLTNDEGLGYSNVILYDKTYRILYYEFNQNGCWLNAFIDFVKSYQRTQNCPYDIRMSASVILRNEAYERLMRFGRYSQIELKIAEPDQMVLNNNIGNDAIINTIRSAQGLSMDTLNYIFKVDTRRMQSSLNPLTVRSMIERIRLFLNSNYSAHFLKFKVSGTYTEGGENGNLASIADSIDLIEDKFFRCFDLEEPRIRQDLQLPEKRDGIIEIYRRCLPDTRELFRENN